MRGAASTNNKLPYFHPALLPWSALAARHPTKPRTSTIVLTAILSISTVSGPNITIMTGPSHHKTKPNEEPYNIFRDSPVRYLGYCNEVGESFRYQFPRFVTPSYVISFGYCCADAVQASWRVWSHPNYANNIVNADERRSQSLRALVDTIVWQSTASVVVPGFTINCIVKATRWMVRQPASLPAIVVNWGPTAAGLGSIPFIVHPIDSMTDYVMDATLRKVWPDATASNVETSS